MDLLPPDIQEQLDKLKAEHARVRELLAAAERSRTEADMKRAQLHELLATAERGRAEAESARDQYRALYMEMLELCKKLERGLLGQKAERLAGEDQQQLSLSILEQLLGTEEADRAVEAALAGENPKYQVTGHERIKPTGRKPLPEHLERVDIQVLPPEVEQDGLAAFNRIGAEVTEVLERRPASMVVVRVTKPKFIRKERDKSEPTRVLIGRTPERPIPQGMAGPGLLADSIVKRWDEHQPLHRLERVYAREGVELARSTMCGWHQQLAELARPLIAAMKKDAFAQPYLCVDATGVLVQAKEKCHRSHFWVMVAPERHVLFRYSRRHDSRAVDQLLKGYRGYLVADAHTVYDHLYLDGKVTEVACWAHCRRYYYKALSSDPDRAKKGLGFIGALFKIERSIAGSPRKKRKAARKRRSAPVVKRFFDWCDEQVDQVLDETPISRAIGYSRNQREALKRFLTDGQLPLSNNISERELRREAVGRKNWVFVGSDDGAEANAVFVSLIASCQMHGVEPWSYLRDLLTLLPDWTVSRLLELAPMNWEQTRQQDDTQLRLAANPYRQIAAGNSPLQPVP